MTDTSVQAQGAGSHRILLVAPSPPPYGGMALQARMLERMLRRDGHHPVLFASNFALPGSVAWAGRIPGIRTAVRFVLIWPKLYRAARRAEVIHILAASWVYFFAAVWPAVVAGRLAGRRVVLNYRGGEAGKFFSSWGWAAHPVFRLAHVVTAPSEFLAKIIRERFGTPVEIVSNIVDLSAFRYRRRTQFRPAMLVTRHLEEMYDVGSVLKAFRRIQKRYPDASLWIAGSGTQEVQLRAQAAEWELANVRFLGSVPHSELPRLYDACDILMNASRVDNFPASLIEAAAAGLLVVSTNAGGIPFVFEHERNALLVDPGDWEGLALQVERAVSEPALATQLTAAAALRARECDWQEMCKSLYKAYGFQLHAEASAIRTRPGTGLHVRHAGGSGAGTTDGA